MEELVPALRAAIEGGTPSLIVAAVLMILVLVVSKAFGKYIPPKWRPLFASVIGVVSVIATALVAGVPWYYAVGSGVLLGTSAGGQWSLWGKYLADALKLKDYGPLEEGKKENPGG